MQEDGVPEALDLAAVMSSIQAGVELGDRGV